MISVSVDDDQERQTADRTFDVMLSSDHAGTVFIPRERWSFTIPPSDLEVRLDPSMGPARFMKGAAMLRFTTGGLQNSKTFAVSSTDTRIAVRPGLITTDQDSFDVTLSLTQGAELEIKETIELEVSHLDALQPSARNSAQISAGDKHTCAIRDDSTVACWGNNSSGQSSPPEGKFLVVSAERVHACAIRDDSTVACWGNNSSGQSSPPEGKFLSASVGSSHTCAIRDDSTVACWGSNSVDQSSPPEGRFLSVSAGENYNCGIRIDNTVACWGNNSGGQSSPPEGRFLAVSAGGSVGGSAHTCGILMDDGIVTCWGDDSSNQKDLTDSSQGNVSNKKFLAIEVGRLHTCGILMDDGTAACWGNKSLNRSSPTSSSGDQGGPVREKDRFLAVSAGAFHTCAVRENAAAACWGRSLDDETIVPSSAEGGFQKAAVIPDTFYLLEKQDMNVPIEIQSAIRLRIKVFLEGALR